MTRIQRNTQSGNGTTLTVLLVLFIALVAAGTWAAYTYGDGHIIMNGQTIDELQPWEVVLGVVIGILGAIIGILAGFVGIIIGLLAAAFSIALAFVGVAASLFVVAGVLAGPVLLLALVIYLFTRNSGKSASNSDENAPLIESTPEPAEA